MSVRPVYRFARIPEWILDHPNLEATDIRLYCVLDRFDGSDCIPKLRTLAERLHVSEDTVSRAAARLKKVGALVVEKRWTDKGGQTSNRYRLVR